MQTLLQLFSVPLRQRLLTLPTEILQDIQEIRVREMRPLEVGFGRSYGFVQSVGAGLCAEPERAYVPSREDCAVLLEMLTQHSLYTYEEELRRGYITVVGGHRVGLAGRTVLDNGKVKHLKDISSFNIRIAKQVIGTGERALPYLLDAHSGPGIHHTLIVSPPQQGKTTLLRDLARIISSGASDNYTGSSIGNGGSVAGKHMAMGRGCKVGIVDERSEIAACVKGVPRFDLGPRTDVLDGCPKAEGMMMMIRSLSPDVLMVDEIGRPEDAAAIHEAIHAGIRVIATAHGLHQEDVRRRPVLRELLAEGVFGRVVVLNDRAGSGSLEGVYDAQGRRVTLAAGEGNHADAGRSCSEASGLTAAPKPDSSGSGGPNRVYPAAVIRGTR
ncbi:stage III sporulation protein AA [Paenibacillus xerothermodurans]|uniref:Stage III sporulation protein AA n=1 Tax=Paenibacillus xerothermodurans TaxID=1977292 RepID=A0A2W1P2V3_PAEXE|nr:stage III sporulation protein AA [Paenibacillus xerothermodurans]PZE22062.1 stage III sporulation protein AA [Paenibacillus xerothermodurans]